MAAAPPERGEPRAEPRSWPVWKLPLTTAGVGVALLAPWYVAARQWDLARVPLGSGHWPGESGWPAGSGASEFGPGVLPLIVGVLLLVLAAALAALVAALIAGLRRCRRRPARTAAPRGGPPGA